MFKNYLLTALRSIRRNLRFSIINILGLSFGIACCMAIFLFVKDELSYDKFHSEVEDIYQVIYVTSNDLQLAQVPPPVGPVLKDFHPEVEASARLFGRNLSVTIKQDGTENSFEEEDIFFADSTIAEIFTFEWKSGNRDNFLREPGKVWINEELEKKYFPGENALGKEIIVNGNNLYQVAGVLKDFPSNSHIHFNMLFSYDEMYRLENDALEKVIRQNFTNNWVASHSLTYVKLHNGANPEHVNERMPEMIKGHAPESLQLGQTFKLVPLLDVHLLQDVYLEPEPTGNIQYIYIFSAIAFLTLLIACFNYINLSTAQSARRVKEIGMRKALGAKMSQLFAQFLGESVVITFFAFILAVVILNLTFPFLEQLTGKEFHLSMLADPLTLIGIVSIFFITAILGGSYPALFISNMNTLKSLKSQIQNKSSFFSLRRILVMLQFAISIMLIAGSIVIYNQIRYLQDQPLGYQTEAVITIPILSQNFNNAFGGVDSTLRQRLNSFADEAETHTNVKGVSFSSSAPGMGTVGRYGIIEGQESEQPQIVNTLSVDYDFIKTYGLQIVAGRDFKQAAGSDHQNAFIINETAVKEYNWQTPDEAIGKEIDMEGKKGLVVGVVKDFHTTSLHNAIQPVLLHVSVGLFSTMSVVVKNNSITQSIDFLKSKWEKMFPEKAFEYTFLDNSIEELYENEQRLGNIIGVFALLAIFVSCLGAYGLMILTTQQRMKEIGIRKVLGANVRQLVGLLLKESLVLMTLGFIIGIPVAWWWGNGWLENFDYRMQLTPIPFLIGGLISMLLVWTVVSFQTIRAANCNPATVIKDE